ncbi:hypothetical protein ABI582_01445 [Pseudomonas sp. SAS7]|uniref:hypothetical protein n=1 Tax=Pseudomonas sp. SAS7 TaxID=3156487 RepID=UPI003F97E3CF
MSEQPIQLDTLHVQVKEVPLRKLPGGPDRMFVQTDGTGKVLVDFADGVNEWGKALTLSEKEYEALRQEAFRRELTDLEDIPTYTQLYPSSKNSGATTTPNGNTLGRVSGETPPTGAAADYSNPKVESETSAEGITGNEILDGLQLGLDVVGLIPVFGELADVANAGISLARGDYAGAALSLLSAIPFVGYLGTAGKVGRHGANAVAEASAKGAKEATERNVRNETAEKFEQKVQSDTASNGKNDKDPGGKSKPKAQLKCGQKGSYSELVNFDAIGAGMERDHIPPQAALLQQAKNLLAKTGQTLDDEQLKTLRRKIERHGQAVSIPEKIHRDGITNSNPDNKSHARDLQKIARDESRNHRENMRRSDKNHQCLSALQQATGEIGKITNKQYDDFLIKLLTDTITGKKTTNPWKNIL